MPDGGAFVTAPDTASFWDALFAHRLLGPEMTVELLRPHVVVDSGNDDGRHYGYGLWISVENGAVSRYACSGADPGVAFISARFAADDIEMTLLGNTETDAWPLFSALRQSTSGPST